MAEITTVWVLHFIVLSLVAAVFIWIGVRFCGAKGGDYFTAVWVGAATILAIELLRFFFPLGVGIVNGNIVSAVIALLILTLFISMSYDIPLINALGAAIIATAAILIAIIVLPTLGIDPGIVSEAGYGLGTSK